MVGRRAVGSAPSLYASGFSTIRVACNCPPMAFSFVHIIPKSSPSRIAASVSSHHPPLTMLYRRYLHSPGVFSSALGPSLGMPQPRVIEPSHTAILLKFSDLTWYIGPFADAGSSSIAFALYSTDKGQQAPHQKSFYDSRPSRWPRRDAFGSCSPSPGLMGCRGVCPCGLC